jgi:lysylphosphatidylglycerol synthetase-like protein (DUF2156 family)
MQSADRMRVLRGLHPNAEDAASLNTSDHTYEISLFAACEYGWPAWSIRRLLVRLVGRLIIAAGELSVRLLHPLHPYRIFVEGSLVAHKAALGFAVVPTRQGMSRKTKLLWLLALYLLIGDVVGSVPGVGLLPYLGLDFHPLHDAGLTSEPRWHNVLPPPN